VNEKEIQMLPTPKQKEVLDFLRSYIREHGMSPTRKEIGVALKLTPPSVNSLINGLVDRGQVKLGRWRPRSIEPVKAEAKCGELKP
jgi:SOS-response transcriptional repressor LexA